MSSSSAIYEFEKMCQAKVISKKPCFWVTAPADFENPKASIMGVWHILSF